MDGSPAVLVKRYNITQQKELEIKLAEQQEALQRCDLALQSTSAREQLFYLSVLSTT